MFEPIFGGLVAILLLLLWGDVVVFLLMNDRGVMVMDLFKCRIGLWACSLVLDFDCFDVFLGGFDWVGSKMILVLVRFSAGAGCVLSNEFNGECLVNNLGRTWFNSLPGLGETPGSLSAFSAIVFCFFKNWTCACCKWQHFWCWQLTLNGLRLFLNSALFGLTLGRMSPESTSIK